MRRNPNPTEIAKLRAATGMSQKELAANLGVHPNHLSYVERGERQSRSLVERAKVILFQKRK